MGDLKFRRKKTKALIRRLEAQQDRKIKFFEINSLVK